MAHFDTPLRRRPVAADDEVLPPARRPRRQASLLRRLLGGGRRRLLLLSLLLLLLWLAHFHPGDATLRALSEPPLLLMVSRTGLSLGRWLALGPKPLSPRKTVLPAPTWSGVFNLSAEVESAQKAEARNCLVAVLDAAPRLVLLDSGVVTVQDLEAAAAQFAPGGCLFYSTVSRLSPADERAAAGPSADAVTAAAWPLSPDGPYGRVAVLSVATSPAALAPYVATLRNKREFCRTHGYASLLALIPAPRLGGRSPKMAKHYALAVLAGLRTWDVLIFLDLDAWFASWAPLSAVAPAWPPAKELLLPDAGQLWLNSGLLLARGTAPWTSHLFASLLDARHHGDAGFKRDQPALWAALMDAWVAAGALPAAAAPRRCAAWLDSCNPDANPVECWHWCVWAPLARLPAWRGFASLDALPHVHVPPRLTGGRPPLHRLCLATCPSALARVPGLLAGALGFKALAAAPAGVDAVSRCDGAGCLRQLAAGGGAWVKHSGHQHWADVLQRCVPISAAQAAARLESASEAACGL